MNLTFCLFRYIYFAILALVAGNRPNLIEFLLSKHRTYAAPNKYVNVSVDAQLYQILNIDEKQQQISALMWMYYEWIDDTLAWNTTAYNTTALQLPETKVWKPDIHMINLLDLNDVNSPFSPVVVISPNGKVHWTFPVLYTSTCPISITNFPFDEQKCEMVFSSWQATIEYLDLYHSGFTMDRVSYVPNDQWNLKAVKIHRVIGTYAADKFAEIHVTFTLTRRPLFYIFTLVVPSLMITSIALIGLFSPSSSDSIRGEKVSLGITTMLTMAVFLLMISDQMPRDSTTFPLLSFFILFQLGLISLGTATSVVILNVQCRGMPTKSCWLYKKIMCNQKKVTEPETHQVDTKMPKSRNAWSKLANQLDKWALIVHCTALFVFTTTIMLYGYNQQ